MSARRPPVRVYESQEDLPVMPEGVSGGVAWAYRDALPVMFAHVGGAWGERPIGVNKQTIPNNIDPETSSAAAVADYVNGLVESLVNAGVLEIAG